MSQGAVAWPREPRRAATGSSAPLGEALAGLRERPRPLVGRLLALAMPLIKLRSELRPVSLGVRGLVFDRQGRILLVRHSYVPDWRLPGGGVEPGETAPQALARELREEGGVQLHDEPRLLGLYHNPAWTAGDHVACYVTGAWSHCAPSWGVEIEAAQFFALEDLPSAIDPSVRLRLAEHAGARQASRW